jgi:hypothetical protein
MNPIRTAPVLLACALLLGACGTSDDRDQARVAVERLYAAVAAQDGAGACAQLSTSAREELESQEKSACEEAILGLDLETDGAEAASVEVFMTSAAVQLSTGETAFLDDTPQGWRVSAVGCSGQTSDTPADCEVQA